MELPEDIDVMELRRLVARLCDGELSSTECEQLDAALRASSAARTEYITLMEIHSRLNAQAIVLADSLETPPDSTVHQIGRARAFDVILRRPLAFAAASLLVAVLLAGLLMATWKRSPAPNDHFLAERSTPNGEEAYLADVVDESQGSSYYIERSGRGDRAKIYSGETLRLKTGRLRVDIRSGVKLTLQGPAAVMFVTDMRARALLGGLKATVGSGAHGFTISTPIADIIDRGTVFGVTVDSSGGTNVGVFAGIVDVRSTVHVDNDGVLLQLTSGEAVRLDDRGTTTYFDLLNDNQFPNFVKSDVSSRPPLITEAYDNLDPLGFGRAKKYTIVPCGMGEDAPAYADRIAHEWNGLTRSGMPSYLEGGDYVKMFENDRAEPEFQLNVKLAKAADIYVLFDERAVPPGWLRRDFKDTGDVVGLDGGPSSNRNDEGWSDWESDVGAGASIDRRFRVWRRRNINAEAEKVLLGANASLNPSTKGRAASMYGVVAVPSSQK